MADNDHNIIKPVEGLQNIAGLTGTKRREERKRRQNLPGEPRPSDGLGEHEEERESTEGELNESVDQENHGSKPTDDEGPRPAGTQNDQHSIDYCA